MKLLFELLFFFLPPVKHALFKRTASCIADFESLIFKYFFGLRYTDLAAYKSDIIRKLNAETDFDYTNYYIWITSVIYHTCNKI